VAEKQEGDRNESKPRKTGQPDGKRFVFLHHNHRSITFSGRQVPHRQFNSAELCILSGIGRTAMSQIKNSPDTPFSLGKCTLQRLDMWLAKRPGFKQQ
jgi:hypothetical protein